MDVAERDENMFPPGKVDEHNEPLDLRLSTSWNQQIDQISTVELLEVQTVNSTVPFMLISAFTPLLKVRDKRGKKREQKEGEPVFDTDATPSASYPPKGIEKSAELRNQLVWMLWQLKNIIYY